MKPSPPRTPVAVARPKPAEPSGAVTPRSKAKAKGKAKAKAPATTPQNPAAWSFRPVVGLPQEAPDPVSEAPDPASFDVTKAMATVAALHRAYVPDSVLQLSDEALRGDVNAMPPGFAERYKAHRNKRRPMAAHKVRRPTFRLALSEEELAIMTAFVEENGFSLSGWVREVLFAAMRKKIPPRHAP